MYGWDSFAKGLNELIRAFKGGTSLADEVTTSTTGANFVQLADHKCYTVTIINDSGQDIKVKVKTSTALITVFNGSYFTFDGIENSTNLSIRRKDSVGTGVTVQYICNSY
jgi:uncharacterized membrane protein